MLTSILSVSNITFNGGWSNKKKLNYIHNESTKILREIAQKEKLSLKKNVYLNCSVDAIFEK